jgi:branched-subunit amino acid transport protein
MSNPTLMITLGIISLGTFLLRFSFIHLYGQLTLPAWMHRSMRFVPAAVLSALIFPALMIQEGHLSLVFSNHRLIAGLIAILVAWRTKNLLATIAAGLGIFWLLMAL